MQTILDLIRVSPSEFQPPLTCCVSVWPVVSRDGDLGSESFDFALPVAEDTSRDHYECGVLQATHVLEVEQDRDGLDGLPQPHVICQDHLQ